jgi:hypothetical protein
MLKAKTLIGMGATLGQVLVNDVYPWRWPPKRHGSIHEFILSSRAL